MIRLLTASALSAAVLCAPSVEAQAVPPSSERAFPGTKTEFGAPFPVDPSNSGISPLAIWRFDDPDDLGAEEGGNYNLTPHNGPDVRGGALGYGALFLASASQYAYVADQADLSIGTNDFQTCGWRIQPSAVAVHVSFAQDNSGAGERGYLLYEGNANQTEFQIRTTAVGAKTAIESTAHTAADRYSACGWYDYSAGTVYAASDDNTPGSDATAGQSIQDASSNVTAGAREYPSFEQYWDDVLGPAYAWKASADLDFSGNRTDVFGDGLGLDCGDLTSDTLTDMSSCWNFSEDGGPYSDSVGSHTMTAVNAPSRVPSLVWQAESGMSAWLVATSTQYFSLASGFHTADWTNGFHIAAWVNMDYYGGGNPMIAQQWSWAGNTDNSWLLRIGTNYVQFGISEDGSNFVPVNKSMTWTSGEWRLVEGTYDPVAQTIGIAIDCGAFTTAAATNGMKGADPGAMWVGNGGAVWDGALDHIRIWDEPLSGDDRPVCTTEDFQ